MNPLVVVVESVVHEAKKGRSLWIWCPGCDQAHRPQVAGVAGDLPDGPVWTWNGATDETFTIDPSYLTWTGDRDKPDTRCHSFVKNGQWEFLADSTHALAGKTVPMVPVPDWLVH